MQNDLIPEEKLLATFGKLQTTTYSQLFRAFQEKFRLLGLDTDIRWTKHMPFIRLFLGAHHGFMNPKQAMGHDEKDFVDKDYITTGSVWSGLLDEESCWNRGVHGGQKTDIPMLNHKPNSFGYDTVNTETMSGRKADMNASLTFRLVSSNYTRINVPLVPLTTMNHCG